MVAVRISSGSSVSGRDSQNYFTSNIPTLKTKPLTGVTVVGSPYTEQHTRVRFRTVDDPCGHTTDRRSVLGSGTPGSLTVVSGGGHSRQFLEVVSAGEGRGAGGSNS